VKECFGIELANRFFSGAYGVSDDDPEERRKQREECHGCPDFEHCCMVLDLVCRLRMTEQAKRGGAAKSARLS